MFRVAGKLLGLQGRNHGVSARHGRTISTRSTVTALACPPHSWAAAIVRSTSGVMFWDRQMDTKGDNTAAFERFAGWIANILIECHPRDPAAQPRPYDQDKPGVILDYDGDGNVVGLGDPGRLETHGQPDVGRVRHHAPVPAPRLTLPVCVDSGFFPQRATVTYPYSRRLCSGVNWAVSWHDG